MTDTAIFDDAQAPKPVITGSGHFDNSYARLSDRFFMRVHPRKASAPKLIHWNKALADDLGLDISDLDDAKVAEIFAGNQLPEGAESMALAYAGHQFGGFSPQLGDGRAHLLGEILAPDQKRFDIQLKGSGRTPFSRQGDGLAAIGPVLRELIISEAMHALGIPTTRTLAAVSTGDPVYREEILPGAVLTRVAESHLRVGTFEFFAARRDEDAITMLIDYCIDRHFPEIKDASNKASALLGAVSKSQSKLVTQWIHNAFIHGVMNTDNMAIAGLTIDYGPCAFMDRYDPDTVFSSIDQGGRYAYSNQKHAAQWNLACLGLTLLPHLHEEEEKGAEIIRDHVNAFAVDYEQNWLDGFRQKIGLETKEAEDRKLIEDLLTIMDDAGADFTLTFRLLSQAIEEDQPSLALSFSSLTKEWHTWRARWSERLSREANSPAQISKAMDRINPLFIPRNHRVELALKHATYDGDFSEMHRLMEILSDPYTERSGPEFEDYKNPAPKDAGPYRTFCGT